MTAKKPLDDFFTFLRFPSISADPAHKKDVQACGEWLVQRLQQAGLEAQLYPTQGHPIVLARTSYDHSKKTVLIYGHYDVQPVDPLSLWTHPPFEPHLENGIVTARGSADNKGQILAHILGVEKVLKEKGSLPVNVIFLIEGEEEVGSIDLGDFLKAHKEELKCDVIAISDTNMVGPDEPAFTYGLRGIACMEISVYGPAQDLHSGAFGGAVANPVTILSRLIASLHDANERIAVPGFYDDVKPLADWERKAWHDTDPDGMHLQLHSGAPALTGEKGFSPVECVWGRPTAEVNGLYGGYQGPGSKTVLPREAHAKFSFRLVPAQKPELILQQVEKHLRAHCPKTVRLEVYPGHHGLPYAVDPNTGFGKAAQSALKQVFGKEPALIREGGSIPIVADFKEILGVDTLLLGLALPDCNAHSPNETFPVSSLEKGIELNRALLEEIAKLK